MKTHTTAVDFSAIFSALPERYVVFDTDAPAFTMLAASQGYLKVTDKNIDEIIGKSLFEIFPDTSDLAKKTGKGVLQRSLEQVVRHKKPDSIGVIRYDIPTKDGIEARYWQATHYPVINKNMLTAIIQSTTDVTELVMNSERTRLAELHLDSAMSAGLVGSWTWDIKNDVVIADKGLAGIFGVSPEKALNGLGLQVFIDSIHPDDQARVQSRIEKAIKGIGRFECEYRTIDKQGITRWVIARGRVEKNDKGEAANFPGVMIDISSRKKAEEELRRSEERLRFMADSMPQLVWVAQPDGYHEYYNKRWYDYTGTKLGKTDGDGWTDLFHEDDRDRARRVWNRSLETGKPYEIKYRLYHAKSRMYRWVIGRAMPYRDANGDIVKWYGTCTDIDDSVRELEERKRLEAELKEQKVMLEERVAERTSQLRVMNDGLRTEIKKRRQTEATIRKSALELERSNQELENFAYVSSHDLQEPLRKIQAFGDLLKDEHAAELGEGLEYLVRMQRAARRMSTLIEDLLAFSRVTSKPAVVKRVDLSRIVHEVVSDLETQINKENGCVEVGQMPEVYSDQTHMRQLFQNLISNGLKFHKPGVSPVVRVSYSETKLYHVIRVKDNGIGIDERYIEKVFAVFQRLNTRQSYEGNGIGLAVCRKIVERYGGTISIQSKSGEGTTFTIRLPKTKGKNI